MTFTNGLCKVAGKEPDRSREKSHRNLAITGGISGVAGGALGHYLVKHPELNVISTKNAKLFRIAIPTINAASAAHRTSLYLDEKRKNDKKSSRS